MKARWRRGFSMVELMVAISVIAIGLFAVMSMITFTMSETQAQKDQAVAKEAVVDLLEKLKNRPFAEVSTYLTSTYGTPSTSPPSEFPAPAVNALLTYQTFAVSGLSYWVQWTPSLGGPTQLGRATIQTDSSNSNLLKVEVTIQWKGTKGRTYYASKALYQP